MQKVLVRAVYMIQAYKIAKTCISKILELVKWPSGQFVRQSKLLNGGSS